MPDLTLDWLWLSFQIILLSMIIGREFLRPRNRNLYALLIASVILVLVHGQAWWLFNKFETHQTLIIRHLTQYISLAGARLANIYVGLFTFYLWGTYILVSRRKPPPIATRSPMLTQLVANNVSYLLAYSWTLTAGLLLLSLLGGPSKAFTEPGQAVAGQTVLLVALSLGKLPFMRKIATQAKINFLDMALLAITIGLTLINSRFLTAFIVLQIAILLNYCWREVSRILLFGVATAMIFIFIVYGIYRDTVLNMSDLVTFVTSTQGLSSLGDWFWGTNVEGFVGLAGILSYEMQQQGISHDAGLSTLTLFTQLIPNGLRNDPTLIIAPIAQTLGSLYPYSGSVVPPGLEQIYAHYGLFGIIGLGILLGYLMHWLHFQMLNPKADRLMIALTSVQSLNFIRGTLRNVFFFGLADMSMLWFYRVMMSINPRQREKLEQPLQQKLT